MPIFARSMRSVAIATVICGAAAALPGSALAAPEPAAHAVHGVGHCKSSSTAIWLGLGNGGGSAGTIFYPLEFSNTGHRSCWLFGYPGVSAVGPGGRQIGQPGRHSGPKRIVVLRPGGTAHAILGIVEAANIAGCHIRHGAFLKVFAPGQRSAQTIPGFTFTACSNRSVLRIDAVHPGTGIPGFSSS
jgi:hypothetical protein